LVRERAALAQQTGIQLFVDTNTYLKGSQFSSSAPVLSSKLGRTINAA
jgi:hypothetical protein